MLNTTWDVNKRFMLFCIRFFFLHSSRSIVDMFLFFNSLFRCVCVRVLFIVKIRVVKIANGIYIIVDLMSKWILWLPPLVIVVEGFLLFSLYFKGKKDQILHCSTGWIARASTNSCYAALEHQAYVPLCTLSFIQLKLYFLFII